MSKQSNINVRTTEALKTDAAQVLATYGLTISEAVRLFLQGVARNKALPAELVMSPQQRREFNDEKLKYNLENRGSTQPALDFINSL